MEDFELGEFVSEILVPFEGETLTFFCKGLRVGEMSDLVLKDLLKPPIGSAFFSSIGASSIVGWSGFQDENGDELGYSKEYVEALPLNVLVEVGRQAYYSLTRLSELENDMFRGYIRYAFARSDKDLKVKMKYFECEACIKAGRWAMQLCGLTPEERERRSQEPNMSVVEPQKKVTARDIMSKYRTSVSKKKKRKDIEREEAEEKGGIVSASAGNREFDLNGFKFKECPTSWIQPWVMDLGEKMLFCHQNGLPYFGGGLESQSQKFYEIGRSVTGEVSAIESEMMEKARSKNK